MYVDIEPAFPTVTFYSLFSSSSFFGENVSGHRFEFVSHVQAIGGEGREGKNIHHDITLV